MSAPLAPRSAAIFLGLAEHPNAYGCRCPQFSHWISIDVATDG